MKLRLVKKFIALLVCLFHLRPERLWYIEINTGSSWVRECIGWPSKEAALSACMNTRRHYEKAKMHDVGLRVISHLTWPIQVERSYGHFEIWLGYWPDDWYGKIRWVALCPDCQGNHGEYEHWYYGTCETCHGDDYINLWRYLWYQIVATFFKVEHWVWDHTSEYCPQCGGLTVPGEPRCRRCKGYLYVRNWFLPFKRLRFFRLLNDRR